MTVRVRFAPSPTGYLHVGGARTALFNWLFAKHEGGVFVLRVEDTDRERSSEEHVRGILDGMRWLELDWDEGPLFQSAGLDRHRSDAQTLLSQGHAYRDFTDPDELARIRAEDPDRALRYPRERAEGIAPDEAEERAAAGEPFAIRFRIPPGETSWMDLIHGELRFRNDDLEDLVILRTDRTPTYNLAVASDDSEMRITHVIRGDDHISNTPKQILLLRALGRPVPVFAHVPMILGDDGKRLSKRHGAMAIGDYADEGILPEAMINFLALMGWSPGTDEEVMTREELVERFSLDRVIKKSAVFDRAKLEWLNGRHMALLPAERVVDLVLEAMGARRTLAEARLRDDRVWFLHLIELLKPRARTIGDLADQVGVYLEERVTYDADAVAAHWSKDAPTVAGHLAALRVRLDSVPWDESALESALRGLAEERGVGAGKLIHPLRVALTGSAASPGIFEVLQVLGRDRAIRRIDAALDHIGEQGPSGA